jgi:hypothetical protein
MFVLPSGARRQYRAAAQAGIEDNPATQVNATMDRSVPVSPDLPMACGQGRSGLAQSGAANGLIEELRT